MSFDEALANRVRRAVASLSGVTEKPMFGGLTFLIEGKMFCGVVDTDLMVRLGPELAPQALQKAHVRPMDFTGRPLTGYVFVGKAGTMSVPAVRRWTTAGASFVQSLGRRKPPRRRSSRSQRPTP